MEDIPTVAGYLFAIGLILVVAPRGFYRFYSNLGLYHKTIDDYDSYIELRNADGIDDPKAYAGIDDLEGQPPADEDPFVTPEEAEDRRLDPQVVVDFEDGEVRKRGEQKWLKISRVWIYTALTTFMMTQLTISYMLLLVDFFSLEDVPTQWVALAILALIVITHLAFRLSSFYHIGHSNWDDYTEYKDSLYNFLFSFNMSILTLWLFSLFAFMLLHDSSPPFFHDLFPGTVIAGAVLLSGMLSVPGELFIREGIVPDDLELDHVREKHEFEPRDGTAPGDRPVA